jgi:shikimate kinase
MFAFIAYFILPLQNDIIIKRRALMPINIILAGFMGVGKSTVGKILADRLDWVFFDTDTLISDSAGMSISEIFSTYGEQYFRSLENRIIDDIITNSNMVIATGGGLILDQSNFDLIKSKDSVIIVLDAPFDVIWSRLRFCDDRPIIVNNSKLQIKGLYEIRRPIYYERADYIVSICSKTPYEIAKEIECLLDLHQ